METPLNEKQRSMAMVKFIIACLACVLFLTYHIIVSIDAYHTDYSKTEVPAVESVVQGGE
jgi:uncharacterized protein with PQ loop repeat